MKTLNLLIYLMKKGAITGYVLLTTTNLSKELGISQQSVSRLLIAMEKKRLIKRKQGIRGYLLSITPEGKKFIEKTRRELNDAFALSRKMVIRGRIVPGLKDGRYYLSLNEYSEKIKSILGFKPYPGTLNIKMSAIEDSQYKERMCAMKGREIPGSRKGDRTLGSLKCFQCKIEGLDGAVTIPERSHHGSDVVEVISPHNLKENLKLSEGDYVKIVVMSDENI